ncbi:RidA family protein [Sphingopyxis sp.]|uniref:RidA family protein n=1 Tax=Sphingopyxis sp. TaxID=1908224 RepID=UPI002DF8509B|nr:RidA family protein [Sphingopyxis sp.]
MTSQPADGPHYSPFTIGGGLIFVSGQLPLRPGRDTSLADAPFTAQVEQALQNLKSVLQEAGADLSQVIKTTVYLSDISDWDELDAAYGRFFGTTRPSRSVVPTGPLHFGFRVEIEAIALASRDMA